MCKVLEITEQGYYRWLKAPLSERDIRRQRLLVQVRTEYQKSKQRYGSPRICRELKAKGIRCSERRVAAILRTEGLRALAARKYRATTNSKHTLAVAENVLGREFNPTQKNKVWAGDITYLWTNEGWLYLAVFLDLFSRTVVGWATSNRIDASLICTAFSRAVARRSPVPGLLVHSDRGAQYASSDFRSLLTQHQAVQSMSRKGNCWDNAVVESFFHSLKVEAIHNSRFATRREAEFEVFDYIEHFYNKLRRHSALEYLSPEVYETEKLTAVG